jgi:hypothetical protein
MLYTFLLQYKQTTCIRQVEASDLKEATSNWVPLLEGVAFGKDESKAPLNLNEVVEELKESRLVPLKDMQNVYCSFIRFGGVDALINVVQHGEVESAYALA